MSVDKDEKLRVRIKILSSRTREDKRSLSKREEKELEASNYETSRREKEGAET